MIDTTASAYRRHYTERYGREDRKNNRSYRELDRRWVTAQNGLRDRFLVSKRNTQIAVQDTRHVRPVLSQNRLIQAQLMPQSFDLRRGSAFAQHLGHGIARNQMNQKKDQRHHDPHNLNRQQQTPDNEGKHNVLFYGRLRIGRGKSESRVREIGAPSG